MERLFGWRVNWGSRWWQATILGLSLLWWIFIAAIPGIVIMLLLAYL